MNKHPKKWMARILASPVLGKLISWSKKTSIPGFSKVPIYDIIIFIRNELQRDSLTTRANSMAFSFFLSIFPAIIVFFTFIAYTPLATSLSQNVEQTIFDIMPGNAGEKVVEVIETVTKRKRSGLMSISFLLALFFASNGIFTMLIGFNKKSYQQTFRQLGFFRARWLAIKLTLLLALSVAASILFGILGNTILTYLDSFFDWDIVNKWSLLLLSWLVIFLIYYTGISLIYRFGMVTHKKQSYFSPGATLATILSLLTSILFSFYVDNYALYNKIYGPIGTLIMSMIWIQLNSTIILIGFELNASIAVNRDLRLKSED